MKTYAIIDFCLLTLEQHCLDQKACLIGYVRITRKVFKKYGFLVPTHRECESESHSVVSDSLQPHGLYSPWSSPGQNTGVGCHFLLQCMKEKSESEGAQSCPTLRIRMDCSPPGSSVHRIFQARVLEWVAIAFSKYLNLVGINQYQVFFLVIRIKQTSI